MNFIITNLVKVNYNELKEELKLINLRIETPNLIIRKFSSSDSKDATYYSQQPNVAYWMSDMVLHKESEALSWIHWINEKFNITTKSRKAPRFIYGDIRQ